jgi:hypothetical protein
MPRLPWLLLLAFVLCTPPAAPADQPQEQLTTQYTTTVQGTVPDLTGRWLVVGYVGLQGKEESAPISLGWNITQADGKLNVVPRFGGLPPGAKAAYDAAVSQQAPWEPTEEQLHEVRDGWETVAPDRPPIASIETTIRGPDALGDLVKTDPTMAGALFAITMVTSYAPGPDRPTKDIMGFVAKEPAGDGYRGSYGGVTVANAPHMAPIAFKGTFRMYRLGPVPQPSWWARVLDIFKGCGRTKAG